MAAPILKICVACGVPKPQKHYSRSTRQDNFGERLARCISCMARGKWSTRKWREKRDQAEQTDVASIMKRWARPEISVG